MTNYKEKYPIGSQWECRDGSRAVVVSHHEDYVLCANEERIFKLFHHSWDSGDSWELIAPWKEKRVEEVELIMIRRDDGTAFTITCTEYSELLYLGKDIIARKKITIVEGEGM